MYGALIKANHSHITPYPPVNDQYDRSPRQYKAFLTAIQHTLIIGMTTQRGTHSGLIGINEINMNKVVSRDLI